MFKYAAIDNVCTMYKDRWKWYACNLVILHFVSCCALKQSNLFNNMIIKYITTKNLSHEIWEKIIWKVRNDA